MQLPRTGWFALLLLLLGPALPAPHLHAAEPDFAQDVRPIFQKHCASCHGEKTQKSGLRLDQKAVALKGGDSGEAAVVPGKPSESLLLKLVKGDDPDRIMPPKGDRLTADEIALLTRWIEAGAAWPDDESKTKETKHWSFIKPVRPPFPPVKQTDWPRNAIDHFVLAKLEQAGLKPNPEADRHVLIRRLSLDLIGLPPTPEDVEAFVSDDSPNAYEKVVERLLASPHYGERWARKWLDLARYADTNGYEKDQPRSMWPWRDWVIQSLNADLPFDQFTIEQLAGDLLPDGGLPQQIATGFHRNTMVNEEGGIDVEEFRFHSIVDRVGTTGTTWLGLTIGCAQCHTHKYDPISHREYYGLFALFNNCDEPVLTVPDEAVTIEREQLEAQIARLEEELAAKFPLSASDASSDGTEAERRERHLARQFLTWQTEATARSARWSLMRPRTAVSKGRATMTINSDGSVLVSGDKPNRDVYEVSFTVPLDRITALRLEVLPDESLPDNGPGRAPVYSVGDFLLSEFSLDHVHAGNRIPIRLVNATESYTEKDHSAAKAIDGDLDTGWSIKGRTGEAHQAVFPLEDPINPRAGDPLRIVVTLTQHFIHQLTIGRFRISATDQDGEIRASGQTAEIEELLLRAPDSLDETDNARLKAAFLQQTPLLAKEQAAIAALKKSLPRHPTTLVLQEREAAHARVTRRHPRGEFLRVEEVIAPGTPAVLPPLVLKDEPPRLAFARWLVSPDNPLTSRVTVNRQWEAFFGRGLVKTSEDFGTQGAKPSHPDLLEWLAVEFQSEGWSLKNLHRLIVTSATYRQSAAVTPEHLTRDPQNELLARSPRLRLEAELLRDEALAVSGLLNPRVGGPSVFPPQPDGVTQLAYGKPVWKAGQGSDRYRRGLYTWSKRTSPYASFALFDAPSGEVCVPRRNRSTTPLQALTLLNDVVFNEAAQALAHRVSTGPEDLDGRVRQLFLLTLSRPPDDQELATMREFVTKVQAQAAKGELDAARLTGAPTASPEAIALTPWVVASRMMLNLDEFLTRD